MNINIVRLLLIFFSWFSSLDFTLGIVRNSIQTTIAGIVGFVTLYLAIGYLYFVVMKNIDRIVFDIWFRTGLDRELITYCVKTAIRCFTVHILSDCVTLSLFTSGVLFLLFSPYTCLGAVLIVLGAVLFIYVGFRLKKLDKKIVEKCSEVINEIEKIEK